MISETTASGRGAPVDERVAWRTRGRVYKWLRLAPLLLGVLVATGSLWIGAFTAQAQDDVLFQDEALVQADVLEFVESQFGGYGLRQASAVAVSPDDLFVYVASEQDDAVVLFSRDVMTGSLTYIATYVDGENNVSGLNDPVDLAISADGQGLYVVGKEDDALVVFARDAADGRLTYVETQVNDAAGVVDMVDPDAVYVSPDGLNVYVAGDAALTVFRRSAADGKLEFVESEQGDAAGSFVLRDVIVSPDNQSVYVTSHLENAVAVLDRDAGDMGKVSVSQVISDGVAGVTGLFLAEKLSISSDGANVYATGALSPTGVLSGTVVVFSRGGDGLLTYADTLVQGEDGVDGIAGARSIETSAGGQNVYVAGTTGDSLAVFTRSGAGALAFAGCFTANADGSTCTENTEGLLNPSGIALSAGGTSLYVTAKESDSLTHFDRNTASGALTFAEVLLNSDGGVPGLGGADSVAVSPDGKHVYVTAERDNALVVFTRRRSAMGALRYVETVQDGEGGVTGLVEPSSVTVSPDGQHVYATGYAEGSVVVFARDEDTGSLAWVETQSQSAGATGLAGAWRATLSPDGANLYATGSADNAVAVFTRDAATGKLTQVQVHTDGANGVTGLKGSSGIVASADGAHVYVTGITDDSVVAFRRDGAQGELTYIATYSDLPGLNGAVSVDVSTDGENVYVAGVIDGKVAAFQRDATTGMLSYLDALSGATDAEVDEPIVLYWSVAVSPDGKYVYAARWEITVSISDPTGNVVVFARVAETGFLSKAQVLRNDEGDVRGLRTPTEVTASADGRNVYVTSTRDSATLVFQVSGSAEYTDVKLLPFVSSQ